MKIRMRLLSVAAWAWAGLITAQAAGLPNILWITSEDNGPQLGCYGDDFATTPRLDELGRQGMIYRYAWSTAPVCAPARTALISGMYPSSTGSEHMRSLTRLPEGMWMYPQFLRQAGYYCSNNSKEDYNLEKPGQVWDESSPRAHYRNRAPGQPFFAIFNFTTTHESQIRRRPHMAVHDPARVRVPAYHPDRPEVRQDWAQYYDKMTEMDAQAGGVLDELAAAGLAASTIVFYYGDHGPGMPRDKRCPYNSGLHVPLMVYVPPAWQNLAGPGYLPGGVSDRLVSFVDFGPTVLSLAGIPTPAWMQGRAFLGPHTAPALEMLHGLRGRMDERIDLVRTVFDGRYVYVRNYHLHRPLGQHVNYMFQTPTTRVWKELFDAGQLTPAQSAFWLLKEPEELYDLQLDPDEVVNLAGSGPHRGVLERLRAANQSHLQAIRDVGFLPEGEIHARSGPDAPYTMARDPRRYPMELILAMAELAAGRDAAALPRLVEGLSASDSAVRYWAALGILTRGMPAVAAAREPLRQALHDPSLYVRAVAAEALGRFGDPDDLEPALDTLLACADAEKSGAYAATAALNALDALGDTAAQRKAAILALPTKDPRAPQRASEYPARLIQTLSERLP
jgi:arylsulfatase A-like enzyme